MTVRFLDTNGILRYLTQDNPDQGQRAYAFLQKVESGAVEATTEAVLAEVVYVLSSKILYNLPRAEIATRLGAVIALKGLKLRGKGVYLRALDVYATTRLDFVDALLVAHAEYAKDATIVSFDRDYDKLPSVTREEP